MCHLIFVYICLFNRNDPRYNTYLLVHELHISYHRIISSQETHHLLDEYDDNWLYNTKLIRRPSQLAPREPWDNYFFEIEAGDFQLTSDLSVDLQYHDSNWNTHYYRPFSPNLNSLNILYNLFSDPLRIRWKSLTVNSTVPLMMIAFSKLPFFLRLPPISITIDTPNIRPLPDFVIDANNTRPLPEIVTDTNERPPNERLPTPPLYTSASNPFSRARTRYRLRNDVPQRGMSIEFTLPAVGQSIYTTQITRSDLYIPPVGLGFLFPNALLTPCAVDFNAPGWLSDHRIRPLVNRLQSGTVYMFLKGPNLRSYYILLQDLPDPQNSRYCVTLSDASHFVTFISLEGVSNLRYRSLYNKLQEEIKKRDIIRLSSSCNLYLFLNKIPPNQHAMALSLAATPLESRNASPFIPECVAP